MPENVARVLVVGGGFSGMAAAIEFRKRGVEVDLVEIDPGWRSYGAGISLGGATLRAFRTLGVLDDFLATGYAADGVNVALADGTPIGTLPTPRLAGADVPGGGAIMRPALAKILADATRASGTDIRLGCTVETWTEDAEGIDVTFSDGTARRYHLVIGADGLYSTLRTRAFPRAPTPAYSGQGVWRAVFKRPAHVETASMWVGERLKAGVNPVSHDEMYLFLTENRPANDYLDPAQFVAQLRDLLGTFGAPEVRSLRDQLGEPSQIVYRPLESLLMPLPWSSGRIALIGDAVHATTPHLASGACIGIEDAIVLADECTGEGSLADGLARFEARRWERCRMVVENSARLGEIEIAGGDRMEHAAIMRESLAALAQPI
ncbi:FAD-dependent oxidoreductase [Paraburkholderia bannensis]|uniref:FAD-dependent oxidoreductase n=1 Tax=Paraburkholderia bannensis TaxID=765414 RepID=UPI002AC329C4|nr:FAD-dependent oxidoreductase [Paraburkholderia bannensis]